MPLSLAVPVPRCVVSGSGAGTRLALALVVVLAALELFTPAAALARPDPNTSTPAVECDAVTLEQRPTRVTGLSSSIYQDTISYGGTWWAPDSLRWEALRDSCWTFDTGVGSSINLGGNPNKPVGYHQTMEGWYGIDQTIPEPHPFRRTSTCAIAGSFSIWCGLTAEEAEPRCWAAGQGYGNSWESSLSKVFQYPGSGNVTLNFKYAVESEPGFDYVYARIDTTGGNDYDTRVDLQYWAGTAAGTASFTLVRGSTMRSTPGPVRIILLATSDGSYSDEDGMYTSTCGLVAFDDIVLGGAIVDTSDFESTLNGWTNDPWPYDVSGDFSNIVDVADVAMAPALCNCSLQDSVLVFFDEMGKHDMWQDNIAASPWIDLLRSGETGRPGRLMIYDVYAELSLYNYIYVQLRARYYPYVCPVSGVLTLSPWRDQNTVFYYGEAPFCTTPGVPRLRDYSTVIGPGAEQVQLAWGMLNLCGNAWFPSCTGISNTTPWFDNISLGIYGTPSAPAATTISGFQDNFATDGLTALTAPGRIDINRIKGPSTPVAGSVLGDTLVAGCAGSNIEVRLVFRVRPGPFTDAGALAARAARWTPEPTLSGRYGGAWYSARMDTAQQGNTVTGGQWMSTFHEDDAGFQGTDTSIDPSDAGPTGGHFRLANDMIPDNLFTPGSRLDYFVAGRYLPPDPRNPGGTIWVVNPDTSGAYFNEVEILPSSADSNMTWNCTLYVDHHTVFQPAEQAIEETGLTLALGGGGQNAEGTRFDRFDVITPSGNQMSVGRPAGSPYGMDLAQARQYRTIVWHSAGLSTAQLTNEDAVVLDPWLTGNPGLNRFWGSGDGLAQSMHATGGSTRAFLNATLGVTLNCGSVRLAACPTGTLIDSSYCLPMVPANDAHFASSIVPRARGNGCPEQRQFDVLNGNPATPYDRGQLIWTKGGNPVGWASVTTHDGPPDYKSVLDGMAVGSLRANPGTVNSGCDDISAALARSLDVLTWFDSQQICPIATTSVPDPGGPAVPVAWKAALRAAVPNPWSPATRIAYVNPVDGGEIVIELFDITGRLVRKLAQGAHPAGPGDVGWDGRAADGTPAAQGLYFYRMTAGAFSATERLVLIR